MRCQNETVTRMPNEEDKCTGRFWEGPFGSQALLDEAALVSGMAFVDLNPIRACLSESLEDSEFTSIQERLINYRKRKKEPKTWLKPLAQRKQPICSISPLIENTCYIGLVGLTGRAIRDGKQGAIPVHIQPILQNLEVSEDNWLNNTHHFGSRFLSALGGLG